MVKKARLVTLLKKIFFFASVFLFVGTGLYFLFSPNHVSAAWYNSSWKFREKITIDQTYVTGSADLTNFPVLINRVSMNLRLYAQSDADDVLFTSADGSTKLDHEIEKYTASTGELIAWVEIPTLDFNDNTSLYMYYGNANASSQQNATGVWDTNYQAVWHLREDPSGGAPQMIDSTSNTNDGTSNGSMASGDLVTGKVDGAINFDGSNDYISVSNHASLNITGVLTVSAWVKMDSGYTSGYRTVLGKTVDGSNANRQYLMGTLTSSGFPRFAVYNGSTGYQADGVATLNAGEWYHMVGVFDGTLVRLYINGTQVDTSAGPASINSNTGILGIGRLGGCNNCENTDGVIDTVRISNTNRSADWITTEYNNQSSPSTFYTFGTQEKGPNTLNLYWGFDEGYGSTVNDQTPDNNSGTISGATWRGKDLCLIENCLQFDGVNDFVSRTYSADQDLDPSSNSFSISAWFKHSSNEADERHTIISRINAGGGYKLYMQTNELVCFGVDRDAFTPEDEACSTATYNDSKWHYAEAVKSGSSSITLYIDGQKVGEDTSLTVSTGSLSGTTNPFYVGSNNGGGSEFWDGFIDEVRYYGFAKTSSQVQTDTAGRGAVQGVSASFGQDLATASLNDGLVGYWKMDEADWTNDCSTDSALDSSGNGFHGDSCPSTTGPDPTAGKFAKAGNFDGSDDYVRITENNALDPRTGGYTLSIWMKGTGTSRALMGNYSGQNYIILGVTSGGKAILQTRGSVGTTISVTSSASVDDGNWHLVTGVRDKSDGKIKIYVDGLFDAGAADTTDDINPSAIVNEYYSIGGVNTDAFSFAEFLGTLDDARIYRRALSSSEVTSLYGWGPGPLAWWKLDEKTGTSSVNDFSGNGYTGTLNNIQANDWVSGKFGGALDFDAANDSVSVGDSNVFSVNNTNRFTVEAWVNPRTLTQLVEPVSKGTGSNYEWAIRIDNTNNSARAYLYDSSGATYMSALATSNTITVGQWNHIAFTVDLSAPTMSIYVNGVALATSSSTVGTYTNGTASVRIGERADGLRDFDGAIDDVRIYDYARTSRQILEDMNADHPAVGTPVASSIGLWNFDEGTGTTTNNIGTCGSACNGTLTSMASPATSTSGWSNTGKYAKALNFDGTDDYVNATSSGALDNLPQYTYTAWIYPRSLGEGSAGRLFDKASTAPAGKWFSLGTNNKLNFTITASTTSLNVTSGTNSINMNTWQHVAVVSDNTLNSANTRLYINGKESTYSNKTSGSGTISDEAAQPLLLGNNSAGTATFDGLIDEMKVYGYQLSSDQIMLDYNQGKSIVLGSTSTETDGLSPSSAAAREYCVPGDTSTCSSPVAEWKLDEKTGTSANDTSGNANVGTLNGSVPWAAGKFGSALDFNDNTANFVSMGDVLDINDGEDRSFTGWLYKPSIGTNTDTIIGKKNGVVAANTGYAIQISTAGFLFFYAADGTDQFDINTINTIPTGQWFHFAVVWDESSSAKLYINGKDESGSGNGAAITDVNSMANSASLRFGGLSNTTVPFNGKMDQIRVYDFPLTAAQVAWDYNRGKPVAQWDFDECSGTTLNDVTGNGNTGTITIGGAGTHTTAGTCGSGTASHAWNAGTTGKYSSALGFDGTDDAVNVGDLTFTEGTSQLSWAFWMKADTLANGNAYLAKGNAVSTQTAWAMASEEADSSSFAAVISASSTDLSTFGYLGPNSVVTGQWIHFAVVYDGTLSGNANRLRIYKNGKLQTASFSGTIPASTQATTSAGTFGGSSDGLADFDGLIDDVRIYRYPLTTMQVQSIYNENSAVRFGP